MSGRAPPGKWSHSRLKPVTDPLESVGFVSKGDRKYGTRSFGPLARPS